MEMVLCAAVAVAHGCPCLCDRIADGCATACSHAELPYPGDSREKSGVTVRRRASKQWVCGNSPRFAWWVVFVVWKREKAWLVRGCSYLPRTEGAKHCLPARRQQPIETVPPPPKQTMEEKIRMLQEKFGRAR